MDRGLKPELHMRQMKERLQWRQTVYTVRPTLGPRTAEDKTRRSATRLLPAIGSCVDTVRRQVSSVAIPAVVVVDVAVRAGGRRRRKSGRVAADARSLNA